ncbi:MAG: HipA domain-containing protein, partial [Verrucomicrobiota bacterium]|nr:HipA domain-containing protein [Verrucomicrobiota bacterium]
ATKILSHRENFRVSLHGEEKTKSLEKILMVGTSAGGARAKAIVAWNDNTGEMRSGQVDAGEGFGYWLLKFDGVETGSVQMQNPKGYGLIEYAYYKMATAAGIKMSESRLFQEGERRHFITKRYDRDENGGKIHKLSLGSMAHLDYRMPGVHSYEQCFNTIRDLELLGKNREQMFRRMVFNIVARNQDDHVKNIEFLMDRKGVWSLAPAFDMTYSYNPNGSYAHSHQMSMNMKRDNFTLEDFNECGKKALLKRGKAEKILKETIEVVQKWKIFAEEAGVPKERRKKIESTFRLQF